MWPCKGTQPILILWGNSILARLWKKTPVDKGRIWLIQGFKEGLLRLWNNVPFRFFFANKQSLPKIFYYRSANHTIIASIHMGKPLKNIFISSIYQNAGKTTLSLGLYKAFTEKGLATAFMKPVGQQTVTVHAHDIDKDTYLIGEVYRWRKKFKESY